MKSVHNVLVKVFCVQFYQSHATMFLILLGIAGGFMRSEDHIALGSSLVSSPVLAMIPIAVWLVYAILTTSYNAGLLIRAENRFIYSYAFNGYKKQVYGLGLVAFIQLLPAALYCIFLTALASIYHRWLELGMLVAAMMLIISYSIFQLFTVLKNFQDRQQQWAITDTINRHVTKPFPFFFPEWIARKEPAVLIGTKLFSLLLIYATSQLYPFDSYDARLMALTVVVTFSSQAMLIWNLHVFENIILSFTRNLPTPFPRRLAYLFVTLLILLAPDTAMIAGQFPVQLQAYDLISLLSLGWSICVFNYGLLYWRHIGPEKLSTRTFFLVVSTIVAVLFKIPILVISVLLFLSGCLLWKRYYFSYEPKAPQVSNDSAV